MLPLTIQITDSDDVEGIFNIFFVEPSVGPSVSESVRPLAEELVNLYF